MKKRRVLKLSFKYALAIFILITLSFLANFFYDLYQFNQSLKETDKSKQVRYSEAVSKDVSYLANLSKVPFVKKISIFDKLGSNREEVTALIESIPYLSHENRPTRYLIVFQNVAEARGTGGILGAYVVIESLKNQIRIIDYGPNSNLISQSAIPINMPNDYLELYGQNPAILQNSNLSPHFPYGAKIWISLYEKQKGIKIDGVVAVDPFTVRHLIEPLGSIKVDGTTITSENLVSLTLKDAYQKYRNDNQARKLYLANIIKEVGDRYSSGQFSKLKFAASIINIIDSRRIYIFLKDKKASVQLIKSRLTGILKVNADGEYRAVIQNIDASKLDFYLSRVVSIKRISCGVASDVQVRVTLKNTLTSKNASGLPSYVLTRADVGQPGDLIRGSHRVKLFIYGPSRSKIIGASAGLNSRVDGATVERTRPIVVTDIELPPEESAQVAVIFRQSGQEKIEYIDQPLVIPTKINISNGCKK